VPYFDELKQNQTLEPVLNQMTTPLIRQLLDYSLGGKMSTATGNEVKRLRDKYVPGMPIDQFTKMITGIIFQ
jgi:hypothetical protein